MQTDSKWMKYDNGETLGTIGTEGGVILADEEHPFGARITLENNSCYPWAITCGIYGFMVHTTFASDEMMAHERYKAMKTEMATFLTHENSSVLSEDEECEEAINWCDAFVDKYS